MMERIGTASFGAMAIIVMVLVAQLQAPSPTSVGVPESSASQELIVPRGSVDAFLPAGVAPRSQGEDAVANQAASSSLREGAWGGCLALHEADPSEPPSQHRPSSLALGTAGACFRE